MRPSTPCLSDSLLHSFGGMLLLFLNSSTEALVDQHGQASLTHRTRPQPRHSHTLSTTPLHR
jgi:hypothetical protein